MLRVCTATGIVLVLSLAVCGYAEQPDYARDIAPILQEKCVGCHHQGGAGPFSLLSYNDVKTRARQIRDVTRSRYMPPWLPQAGYGKFQNELRLSDQQIQMIGKWVEQGAKGSEIPDETEAPPTASGWSLGKPDMVVEATSAFSVPKEGSDVYWNFVFAPKLTKSQYVRAIEIRPSNPKLIHHANLIVDRMGTLQEAFGGMDVSVPRNPLDLDGHFLFFKPGSETYSEAEGYSWRLDPGATLILNTHIQVNGKSEQERPSLALYFTDQRPTHFPYLLELENDNGLHIPAGDTNFVVRDDFKLPIDTEILAIYPHAHYLGKLLEAYATLPGGKRQWLIRIPDWDPNWQGVYRYQQPVVLPKGTIVSFRYHYNNSGSNPRNPNQPPKTVESGDRATDEMAHLWLQVLPVNPRDSRRIYAEEWARHQLEKNPQNYAANVTIGSLALARLNALAAVGPLRQAAQVRPDDAIAHNLYGTALEATGQNGEAEKEFETAVRLKPDFANARLNLAHCLARAGRKREAVANLKEVLKQYPGDATAESFLRELAQ